jgi:hypothetical protein
MLRTVFGVTIVAAALGAAAASSAQGRRSGDGCEDGWNRGRQYRHCDVREYTLQGVNPIVIDAGQNGGIRVRGWDRADVAVRAIVSGYGRSEDDARRVAGSVRVEAAGTVVRAEGPDSARMDRDDEGWSVSFEIQAPRSAILTLTTRNGGIALEDLQGAIKFRASNGGVSLINVGGDIKGATTNGGVNVDLRGDRWDGAGLDVETTNGGVRMTVPDNYSAVLETGTVNGRINIDFPITVQGRITRHLTTTLGSGGAPIRAMTTNGGVSIRRR